MISLEWVKDYVDLSGEDLNELAIKVTKAGINVEKVVTNQIKNLTIGEILEVKKHEEADKLNVCLVDVGNSTQQIVCGASNVSVGLKVIVALPGAVLPGNFEIKKSKIRGVESNGMICALYELGLEEKTEETYSKGICELNSDAQVGTDPIAYLGLDDTLYELDVHKHRNNDCYYHIGFAYEVGTIINKKVTLPESNVDYIKENINDLFKLEVKTKKAPYFKIRAVKDVVIKESPDFIKKRLIAAGMRPINNVVDISNYVMLEYGQPLHFYDFDKVGSYMQVRDAYNNELLTTLDNKERTLNEEDIVIANEKESIGLAGVMGGLHTEVTTDTKNILIEAAIFAPTSIRYTADKLNLRSEASIRFGKGLSYEYTDFAIIRACHLLQKYADAKVLTGEVTHDLVDKSVKQVKFKKDDVNKMLGIDISTEDMCKELERLDFEYELKEDLFNVVIPSRRLDIEANVNDIAEEIGRLYGYHNLVSTQPNSKIKSGTYKGDVKYRKLISKRLRSLGLNESKTYTLVTEEMSKLFNYENKEAVVLPNPMSIDKSVVRTSLIPSLLNVYDYNKARKVKDILLYEVSKVYDVDFVEDSKISILMKGSYITNTWQNKKEEVDFYLIKGIVENILNYLGFKNRYSFEISTCTDLHPGISANILLDRKVIGIVGKIHPKIKKDNIYVAEMSLNELIKPIKPIKFKEASKYPEVTRDIAFVVKKEVMSQTILDVIKKSGGRLLTDIEVFDVYVGENVNIDEKSLAYSLTFSDPTKTLNDEEINSFMENIIKNVEKICNATLRDK